MSLAEYIQQLLLNNPHFDDAKLVSVERRDHGSTLLVSTDEGKRFEVVVHVYYEDD